MVTPDRTFELIHRDLAHSRLTVAPDRVTLKIAPHDREHEEMLKTAAEQVAAQIRAPVTLRGKFEPDSDGEYRGIYMTASDRGTRKWWRGQTYHWHKGAKPRWRCVQPHCLTPATHKEEIVSFGLAKRLGVGVCDEHCGQARCGRLGRQNETSPSR